MTLPFPAAGIGLPTGAPASARLAGVTVPPLPVDIEGPDPRPLQGRRAKLVYVMPERQNPTGITTSDSRREAIAAAALAAGALIVEDGYEEPESGLLPLAAARRRQSSAMQASLA